MSLWFAIPALTLRTGMGNEFVHRRQTHTGLESPVNPQTGKPALRSADFPVGGFWGLSSPQFITVSSCPLNRKNRLVVDRFKLTDCRRSAATGTLVTAVQFIGNRLGMLSGMQLVQPAGHDN